MKNIIEKIRRFMKKSDKEIVYNSLVGYSEIDKMNIMNMYGCNGVDAVLKYMNKG